ncbi:MAG: beta-propeller domain-containing protein [Candidatus Gracilibacteria bacterium]
MKLPIKLLGVCAFVLAVSCTQTPSTPTENLNGNLSGAIIPTIEVPTSSGAELPLTSSGVLANQAQIKKFGSYDELKEYLENNPSTNTYGRGGGIMSLESSSSVGKSVDAVAPTAMPATDRDFSANGGSDDYSKTNVQVEGVDEGDIVKTDGKYLYSISGQDLYITDAYPADKASVLSKVAFKSQPEGLYLDGNTLVIYGRNNTISTYPIYSTFRRYSDYMFVKVFDVSDKKNPKQIRNLDFEGSLMTSRMTGDRLYLVTNTYGIYQPGEPVVPRVLENGTMLSNDVKSPDCLCPNIYYFDMPYRNYGMTSVASINLKNPAEKIQNTLFLMDGAQNVFMSQDNLYLAYTKYINEEDLTAEVLKDIVFPKLDIKTQTKINKILDADDVVLSRQEKLQKVRQIMEGYVYSLAESERNTLETLLKQRVQAKYADISKELEKTVVQKLGISNGALSYKGYGEVTGQVLNQFSMDEQNGYFRIATTKNQSWSNLAPENMRESYNNLYVLDPSMKIAGQIEDIAQGERIYSVRFMQNRAYMVTFKQTDPLFVIDLATPANPKILGQLKIPGYSNYLHPYDDNTLIGFGRQTQELEGGRVLNKGLKLSLFDVTNVAAPKEAATYEFGDAASTSQALYDHHAFYFSKEKGLLALPVELNENPNIPLPNAATTPRTGAATSPAIGIVPPMPPEKSIWRAPNFTGAYVFGIAKDSITLKGKVSHTDPNLTQSDVNYNYGTSYYTTTVKRMLNIGETLYSLSDKYLKMHTIADLKLVNTLELKKMKEGANNDFEIVN